MDKYLSLNHLARFILPCTMLKSFGSHRDLHHVPGKLRRKWTLVEASFYRLCTAPLAIVFALLASNCYFVHQAKAQNFFTTGGLNNARDYATAALLNDGEVLVAGGFSSSLGGVAPAELYSPAAGIWTVTGSLNNGRAYHTGMLLTNGEVLVAGGAGDSGILSSAEYIIRQRQPGRSPVR